MTVGDTLTDSLTDSIPTIINEARITREQVGNISQLVDKYTLGEGIGLTWDEVSLAAIAAQHITETTELDNPQQISDTLFSITPSSIGVHTFITDRVGARISKNAYAKIGELHQNAIQRKKDQDGITVLDGATTSLAGAGTSLTTGHISAGKTRITSNTTENGPLPVRAVLHGFQIKDLYDELVGGFGSYPVPEGMSADVFKRGFMHPIAGVEIFEDGNITIDAADDAKGGVFSKDGIVIVQGRAPRVIPVRDEAKGAGGTNLYHYDEYAYGERSEGNWVYELYSDATAPTS